MSIEKEYPEWSKAEKRKPMQWFESQMVTYASLALTTAAGLQMWDHIQDDDRLYLRILAAGVYIGGSLLDMDSTAKGLDKFSSAKKKKIKHPVYEENPLMPGRPEKEEFMKHKRHVLDYVSSGVSVLIPPLGLGWGVFRAMAALNNYSQTERLDIAIQISNKKKKK